MITTDSALERLSTPLDALGLAAFRAAVGLIVTISALRFLAFGWIDDFFVAPRFYFKYWGLSWVTVPDRTSMYALFCALVVLGVMFSLGVFFRVTAALLFFAFAYLQLLDVTNYLNHYYLMVLLLGLCALMPLGDAYGLDAKRDPARARTTFPTWMTWLLRVQVACVYFYAGKAKFTSDWLLHAQPLNIWLSSRIETPILGAWFGQRWMAYFFSWAGFLFDSTIVFWLSWRRTRALSYVVVVVFHVLTVLLFPIGMFPVIMIVAATIFFSPDWPRRFLRARVSAVATSNKVPSLALSRTSLALLSIYCLFQVLFPLRQHLYGGNVLWDEQGMRFSWKVMVREKNASVTYTVEEIATGKKTYVSPRKYLDARQERELGGQPDLILQLAHRIAEDHRARGVDVRVFARALVSLNGRAPHPLIDSNVDLSRIDDRFARASWILPAPTEPPIHLRSF